MSTVVNDDTLKIDLHTCIVTYSQKYIQARSQTFWGAGAQTKKGHPLPKKILTELKHKQQYTDDAVLDLRLLWAGLDS